MNSRRILLLWGAILALILSGRYLGLLLEVEGLGLRIPTWDEASHGLDGVRFADAWRSMSPLAFLRQLQRSSYWPPAFPLFESVPLLVLGPKLVVARGTVAALAAANVLLVWAIAAASGLPLAALAGVGASALVWLSPGLGLLNTLCMLEAPGVFVTLLAAVGMARYLKNPGPHRWNLVCVLSALLFFTKYNYAIMWIGTLVLWQLAADRAAVSDLWSWALGVARRIEHRRPFTLFCYAYVAGLIWIDWSGGGDYEVFGQTLELRDIWGNPIYLLLAAILLRAMMFQRTQLRYALFALWHLRQPWQGLVRWTAMPIFLWFLSPQNFATFFNSVINESTRKSSVQILTYYPSALVHDYSFAPGLGIVALAILALAIPVAILTKQNQPKFLVFSELFTALSFAAICVHPNYASRYLYTAVPLIFLNACLWLAWGVARFGRAIGAKPGGASFYLEAAAMALVVLATWHAAPDVATTLRSGFEAGTGDPAYARLLDALCDQAREVRSSTVIGYGSLLSPSTVAWHCYTRDPLHDSARLPEPLNHRSLDGAVGGIPGLVDSGRIARYFQIRYLRPEDFSRDLVWNADYYPKLVSAIAASPRYLRGTDLDFPELHLGLTAYTLHP